MPTESPPSSLEHGWDLNCFDLRPRSKPKPGCLWKYRRSLRNTSPSAQAGSRADPKRLHEAVNVGSNPLPVFSGPRSQPVPPELHPALTRLGPPPGGGFKHLSPLRLARIPIPIHVSTLVSSLFLKSVLGGISCAFNSMESPVVTGNLHRASLLVSRCLERFFGLVSAVVPTGDSLSYVRRSEWWHLQISCKY